MSMTAYELRHHLADRHDIRLRGHDYAELCAIHEFDHRPGILQGHEHGPGSPEWESECREFGCHDTETGS